MSFSLKQTNQIFSLRKLKKRYGDVSKPLFCSWNGKCIGLVSHFFLVRWKTGHLSVMGMQAQTDQHRRSGSLVSQRLSGIWPWAFMKPGFLPALESWISCILPTVKMFSLNYLNSLQLLHHFDDQLPNLIQWLKKYWGFSLYSVLWSRYVEKKFPLNNPSCSGKGRHSNRQLKYICWVIIDDKIFYRKGSA